MRRRQDEKTGLPFLAFWTSTKKGLRAPSLASLALSLAFLSLPFLALWVDRKTALLQEPEESRQVPGTTNNLCCGPALVVLVLRQTDQALASRDAEKIPHTPATAEHHRLKVTSHQTCRGNINDAILPA